MPTSYANQYGSGDRTSTITLTTTVGITGTLTTILNGVTGAESGIHYGGSAVAGLYFRFKFPYSQIIDEVKYYQSNSSSHGSYKWQGSNDGVTWTDIGGNFTLGGTTTQTITTLSANVTGYIYYQIIGVSGSNGSSSAVYEYEFKILGETNMQTVFTDTLSLSDAKSLIGSNVKIDSIFIETLTTDIPSAYLDSIFIETLNAAAAYVQIDSIFLEVLYDDYHLTDTLNNWLDAVSTSIVSTVTPLSVGVGDSLSLTDSASIALFPTPLSISVSDSLSLDDSLSTLFLPIEFFISVEDTLSLDDSTLINLIEPLFTSVDDSFSLDDFLEILLAINLFVEGDSPWPQWWDSVGLNLLVELSIVISDTLSLSDGVEVSFQWAPSFSDSFTLTDSISWNVTTPIIVSDSLNFWNDFITYLGGYSVGIFDQRFMADSIRIGSPFSIGVSDFFTLFDGSSGSSSLSAEVEDSFLLTDEVSLTNWFYLDYLLFGAEDDYYRRWLNDRAFVGGEMLFSGNEIMTLRDSISVVRQ